MSVQRVKIRPGYQPIVWLLPQIVWALCILPIPREGVVRLWFWLEGVLLVRDDA